MQLFALGSNVLLGGWRGAGRDTANTAHTENMQKIRPAWTVGLKVHLLCLRAAHSAEIIFIHLFSTIRHICIITSQFTGAVCVLVSLKYCFELHIFLLLGTFNTSQDGNG